MKIVLSVFMLLFSVFVAEAEFRFFARTEKSWNPLFGDKENQLMLNIGQGIAGTWMLELPEKPVPFIMFHFQYSQPIEFFRLPARLSANVIQTIGYGKSECPYDTWNWRDFTTRIAFLSTDVVMVWTNKWYFGTGIGTGIQASENERISTKFLVGLKLFTGYNFTGNWRTEIFFHHFSNGSTSPQNYSYNFYGLGLGYSF
ncbi:MAG: acyloxyacyl hydrolase [Treponema sp.]|jgi:hypothetical protein|nr:acyloxyacyl hydrolase [Treponema sp.]